MPTRRLAAVLFADIVGYTAMMQQNEAEGMAKAQTFRSQVPQLVQDHQGEVIEIKGDGALCIFNSAAEATAFAQEIQVKLGDDIPLRIGIHLGDVMQHSDHIMGDAVNIASRIESMGVAGAVLLSSSIRQQIKNKPEFELVSLGKFAFKNVAEPMTVYALGNAGMVVPKAEQMKGKGDQVGLSSKRLVQLASVGFVAMALGAAVFWATGMGSAGNSQLLDQDIREEKVAVAIFENLTGDKELDVLGYLASEWITIGLQEIGMNTITPEMIRQYKQYIGILPNNPEGKPSFAELTQTQYLISGSYFLKGDSIRLITRLINTQNGNEIQKFPVLKVLKSEKENLVEEARKRLMGYWAVEQDQYFPKIKPPKYGAYQKFLDCEAGNLPCHQEVLAMDSTFLLNHIRLMFSYVWGNYDSLYSVSESYVLEHWNECTAYEKNFYTFTKEFKKGNYESAYDAMKLNYEYEPREVFMAIETALFNTFHLKKPKQGYPIFHQIFTEYELFKDKLEPGQFSWYLETLVRLKRFDEIIDFVEKLPEEDWIEKAEQAAWSKLFTAYLETGRTEKALGYMEELFERNASFNGRSPEAAIIWSTVFMDTIANPFHENLRHELDKLPSFRNSKEWGLGNIWRFGNSIEYRYYVLGDWEEAEKQFLALRGVNWQGKDAIWDKVHNGNMQIRIEAMLGVIYARQGKTDQALVQIAKLEKFRPQLKENTSPFHRGFISWDQARIHAVLGNKEAAVNLLQRSINEGHFFFSFLEMDLASLRGYEPFERLVAGPD